jgi:CheY-like chemotaxis protein
MRMQKIAAMLVLCWCGIGSSGAVLACGDKFLMPSRGSRFQQAPMERMPASILFYANPASPLPAALTRLSVDAALRRVGYRPTVVASLDALERALTQGGWDVIVVDLADGVPVREHIKVNAAAAATVLLPVAQAATGEQVAQARKQYPLVLKSPSRSQAFVEAIDDALAARAAASRSAGAKSR